MESDYSNFFEAAQGDLDDAKLLFEKKRFRNGIFLLQQADEKLGKGLLGNVGFVYDAKLLQKLKSVAIEKLPKSQFTMPILKLMDAMAQNAPKGIAEALRSYGHDFQNHLLSILTQIAPALDQQSVSIDLLKSLEPSLDLSNSVIRGGWNADQFPQRIDKAKAFFKDKAKFMNPPVQVIEEELRNARSSLKGVTLQSKASAEQIKVLESIFGSEITEKTLMNGNLFSDVLEYSSKLIVVAAFGFYLSPHYSLARYLDKKVDFKYNEDLALVKKHKEIISILRECMIPK